MADSPDPWLRHETADLERVVLPRLGAVLKDYRREHHLTQAALGELRQVDQTYVSMALRDAVEVNAEGITVFDEPGEETGQGIPFIDRTVNRLLNCEPMASPGAACLALA